VWMFIIWCHWLSWLSIGWSTTNFKYLTSSDSPQAKEFIKNQNDKNEH
jgi:hypothetical protein